MKWKSRYSVLAVIFIAYFLCYFDRIVMGVAIPFIAKDFSLTPLEMGVVMSAFSFSYALFQIPGGLLADKFGAKSVMVCGLLWWSIFTCFTGLVNSLKSMIAVRVLFGMGEGIFPPAAFKTIASWFPKKEVGRANSIMLSTNTLGPALGSIIVAYFIAAWGWRMAFYCLLVPGLIVAPFIWRTCKHPRESRSVSADEMAEIEEVEIKKISDVPETKIGFNQLIRIPIVWMCFFSLFFLNITLWGLGSWFPTYLLQARGFSVIKMGIAGSLPWFSATIGILVCGYLSDRFFKERRHWLIVFGAAFGAASTYLSSAAATGEIAVVYQIIGFFFLFIAMASIFTIPIAVLPAEIAGSAMGLVNTAGQIAGFLSPMTVGYILNITNSNYYYAFMLFVVTLIASSVVALAMGPTKRIVIPLNAQH